MAIGGISAVAWVEEHGEEKRFCHGILGSTRKNKEKIFATKSTKSTKGKE